MSTTELDLTKFCSSHNQSAFAEPFILDGWRYYTDTACCIRVPTDEPNTESTHAKRRSSARDFPPWGLCDGDDLEPLVVTSRPYECEECGGTGKLVKCPNCDGSGEVTAYDDGGHAYRDLTCAACDGEGTLGKERDNLPTVECGKCSGEGREWPKRESIGEFPFGARYLNMVSQLPGVVATTVKHKSFDGEDGGLLVFKFDGGQGMLIGLRN